MYLFCIQVTFCKQPDGLLFITYVPSIYVFKESQYVPVYIQTTSREKPDGLYVRNVYIVK